MSKFRSVRIQFVAAMLSLHGIYNTRYAQETFAIGVANANRDVNEHRKADKGFYFNHSTLSYEVEGTYRPMPGAAEFLKAISVAFGSPDYSMPGSVTVTRNVASEGKDNAE